MPETYHDCWKMPEQTPASPVHDRKWHTFWVVLNVLVGIYCVPVGMGLAIAILGITVKVLPLLIAMHFVLVWLYHRYQEKQKGKRALYIVRMVTVLCSVVFLVMPYALWWFKDTPSAYLLKRELYYQGVCHSDYCRTLLPERMPETCTDYKCITQGQAIAQDYHPSLYLMFRTTPEILEQYTVKAEALGLKKTEVPDEQTVRDYILEEYEMDYLPEYPSELPGHVLGRLEPEDSLYGSVRYTSSDYYNKGMIVQYETGLVIFWI